MNLRDTGLKNYSTGKGTLKVVSMELAMSLMSTVLSSPEFGTLAVMAAPPPPPPWIAQGKRVGGGEWRPTSPGRMNAEVSSSYIGGIAEGGSMLI